MSGFGIAMGIVGVALIVAALVFGGRSSAGMTRPAPGERRSSCRAMLTSEFDPEGDDQETGTEELAVDSTRPERPGPPSTTTPRISAD